MKTSNRLNILLTLVYALCLLGCSGESSTAQDSPADPEERIIAKWTVNDNATKKGWGERSAEMERMMVDEMGMSMEFKEDNVVTFWKGGRTGDGYWDITNSSGESLEIVVASRKDAEKKVQVKITFQGNDQFLYQSSEMEFGEDLIFDRVTQEQP